MMGPIPLSGGDEYDALTRWRRIMSWRAGDRKAIKRRYNRRVRRAPVPPLHEYDWPVAAELRLIEHDAGCFGATR